MTKSKVLAFTILGCTAIGLTGAVWAGTEFDQNVTPDIIFGSGNSNGGFTTDRQNGIEIGLRAKIPFVGTLHSNGDGSYSYSLAETDHDSNAGTPNRWNFEFTVNTDFDDSTGFTIDEFTYELGMDADPTLGIDFLKFDPVTAGAFASFYDHSIGDNSTPNGGGAEAVDVGTYVSLLANNNVLQQSWRYSFFPFPPLNAYDPTIPGTYAVYFLAKDSFGTVVARSDIQVLIQGADPAGPLVACEGFQPPLDQAIAVKKPNRVLPLRMNLFDVLGNPLIGTDIAANPVVQLTFNGGIYEGDSDPESVNTAGQGDDGNMFVFNDTYWAFNMKTKGLAPGNYTITVVSGDFAEYVVDSTCQVNLTIQ